jgi:hypothetical protein
MALQDAEKVAWFVIPNEAGNLSLAETQEVRDSSHKSSAMQNRTSFRRLRSERWNGAFSESCRLVFGKSRSKKPRLQATVKWPAWPVLAGRLIIGH